MTNIEVIIRENWVFRGETEGKGMAMTLEKKKWDKKRGLGRQYQGHGRGVPEYKWGLWWGRYRLITCQDPTWFIEYNCGIEVNQGQDKPTQWLDTQRSLSAMISVLVSIPHLTFCYLQHPCFLLYQWRSWWRWKVVANRMQYYFHIMQNIFEPPPQSWPQWMCQSLLKI